ncbi:transcription elongation factor A N-terminal and central domain-containing protein [Tachyglossus aculeatus]|uniref:transcription elongation factor A N-terminal and central domain-containing protein n=1 Tax=Tachyglossus aculeatus TaxID=9261 RepID=UPI0018F5B926|nr:transcription elongation factor A N-terminal and central domain-containing protein [Tachyglossus aculeatus]
MSGKKEVVTRASLLEQLLARKKFQELGDHLAELETMHMTTAILQETNVIKVVYAVRRNCPIVAFKKKAKCLLAKWKALHKNTHLQATSITGLSPESGDDDIGRFTAVQEETLGSLQQRSKDEMLSVESLNSLLPSQSVPADVAGVVSKVSETRVGALEPRSNDPFPVGGESSSSQDPVISVRRKAVGLLQEALTDPSSDQSEIDQGQKLAREIEEHIYAMYSKTIKKYKNCIRSKVSNLRNAKNVHLQQNLISGSLTTKAFAEMTVMEMASDELKQLRASYTETCVQEHHLPQVLDGTQTNKIKCRRCEKFDCKVTVISRGTLFLPSWVRRANPDEQMMTYVICNECGEQWYHSKWVCL